ncbi:protein-tyrosine-phosphatase [Opitutus sp. ER46]|uniref:protein-tyrosine-phosphatase n=1 Tax=Opitutus sp. ER46 TaxID=2161864 RepID=UPI000D323FAB|nr:protein-tyrosine-phosphatase [Opitutus sp. ER46]PTX91837.1 protein-tyrosine-phosphatase [Opitutus sp. ER46]
MSAPRLRVLFICALNRRRSATAEQLYRQDARLEVRSAGLREGSRRRLTAADLDWADAVMVMEREHLRRLREQFPDAALPPVAVLDIPDHYEFMQPELQELLRATIEPELAALLG